MESFRKQHCCAYISLPGSEPHSLTYLPCQRNLGEPSSDPLYKMPPGPAENPGQWDSLQPHPL